MPQADLSYSASLDFDAVKAMTIIEQTIHDNDSSSGACKGRLHPIAATHHDHVLLRLAVLEKPHRDAQFMTNLSQALGEAIRPLIPQDALVNVEIRFLSPYYYAG